MLVSSLFLFGLHGHLFGKPHPRDYFENLQSHIACSDPCFDHTTVAMWQENAPVNTKDADDALQSAERQIQAFESNRNDATWQSDCLKLCRDVSMCAKMLEAAERNERTMRLARITHLKEQNRVGASVVTTFTEKNCIHMPLAATNAEAKLGEATMFKGSDLFCC